MKNSLSYEHIGYLVPMKCGHKGKPNRSEEKLLEHLVRESNFIFNPLANRFMTENIKNRPGE